ncbi:MAG: hypothetical protein WAO78_04200 [Roseovarius sp.]
MSNINANRSDKVVRGLKPETVFRLAVARFAIIDLSQLDTKAG